MADDKTKKLTKDDLVNIILKNQDHLGRIVADSTNALSGVREAINKVNDTNVLHANKEDERYAILKKNTEIIDRFIRLFSYIVILLIIALIVLSGAEKALKFKIPLLP